MSSSRSLLQKLADASGVLREIALSTDDADDTVYYGRVLGSLVVASRFLKTEIIGDGNATDVAVRHAVRRILNERRIEHIRGIYAIFEPGKNNAQKFVCPMCRGREEHLVRNGSRRCKPDKLWAWFGLVMHVAQKHSPSSAAPASPEELEAFDEACRQRLKIRIYKNKSPEDPRFQRLLETAFDHATAIGILP